MESNKSSKNIEEAKNTEQGEQKKKKHSADQMEMFWKEKVFIKPKDGKNLNVLLIQKIGCHDCIDAVINLAILVKKYHGKSYIEQKFLSMYNRNIQSDITPNDLIEFEEKDADKIDLLIVLGGDGTILWALQYFKGTVPPIVAFGKGTIGYLCKFKFLGYFQKSISIFHRISKEKPFFVDRKDRLSCIIESRNNEKIFQTDVLNDLVIERGPNPHIIHIDCFLEDKYMTSFQADGLIIATPTGTTAYSLSAGGPIVNHLLPSITMTPICSVKITSKPMILNPKLNLTFKLGLHNRNNAQITIDGQKSVVFTKEMTLKITGSEFSVPFLLDKGQDVVSTWITQLRELMGNRMQIAEFNQEKSLLSKL